MSEVQEEPVVYTSLTPAGLEILYSPAPRRHYKIRKHIPPEDQFMPRTMKALGEDPSLTDWLEIPSVTSVLGVLDKPSLPWWGMKTGVEGVLELLRAGVIYGQARPPHLRCPSPDGVTFKVVEAADELVSLLTQYKLTVNHVKDKAADRGVNVHSILEGWSVDQTFRGIPELYEDHEQGYVIGLNSFLDDLGPVSQVQAEVMVGSIQHGFAGRYDLRFLLEEDRELVTKIYPKRADRREVVLAGRYLTDLKSSKSVYPTHAAQLAAYEGASIEDGYEETDYRAVIHVTADGRYEFVRTSASFEDFLSILQCFNTMTNAKAWLS